MLCMSATSVMGQRDPCGLGHRQVVLLAPPRLRTRGDYHPQPVGVGGFLSPPGRWQRHRGAGCLRPPSPPPPKSPSGCWPWAGRKKNTKKQQQQQQQQQQQAWQGYTLPPPWRLLGPCSSAGRTWELRWGGSSSSPRLSSRSNPRKWGGLGRVASAFWAGGPLGLMGVSLVVLGVCFWSSSFVSLSPFSSLVVSFVHGRCRAGTRWSVFWRSACSARRRTLLGDPCLGGRTALRSEPPKHKKKQQ